MKSDNFVSVMYTEDFLTELEGDILPYWISKMQDPRGGWYGRIDGRGVLDTAADKGAILNSRILWTFSSAYRLLGKSGYKAAADRAYREIRDRFIDREMGGMYWSLDAEGRPKDCHKQFYAIAFGIYGLAEYYRSTACGEALELAVGLFDCIESHSYDPTGNGYAEAAARDWSPVEDVRLSEKDQNDSRTMNTHLHILEAYTGLYRVWKDGRLRAALTNLIGIFTAKIVRPDGHLGLFFGDDWAPHSTAVSYGHDIETSWLLAEAAEVLGDVEVTRECEGVCHRVACAAMEGFTPEGGMIYEYDPASGMRDGDRHWWVQAETVAGCHHRYLKTGDPRWEEAAEACWKFTKEHLLAPGGEWYWSVRADGSTNTDDDRAGFWKCPYHNGRMCMELLSPAR